MTPFLNTRHNFTNKVTLSAASLRTLTYRDNYS